MQKHIKSKVIKINQLTKPQIEQMFNLFCEYYESVSKDKFLADLQKKTNVILVWDKEEVVGFSTIKVYTKLINQKKIYAVFSGDTVLDKKYWGNKCLQVKFTQFVLMQKLKRPFSSINWFLISKGYKTYLMVANTFDKFYPSYLQATPRAEQAIIDAMAYELYSLEYDKEQGLIIPKDEVGHVKSGLADITEDLLINPHIDYFVKKNPNYHKAHELACLAPITWGVIFKTLTKYKNPAYKFFNRKKAN